MSNANSKTQTKSTPRFSLDAWAVLIRAGIIHRIPW